MIKFNHKATIRGGQDGAIWGDFFSLEDPAALARQLVGCRRTPEALSRALAQADVSRYFHGLTNALFVDFICDIRREL